MCVYICMYIDIYAPHLERWSRVCFASWLPVSPAVLTAESAGCDLSAVGMAL